MSATEPVMRGLRKVIGTAGLERLSPSGARTVLRALLFDGAGVPDWHRAAACAGTDAELFFPAVGAAAAMQVQAAKCICRRCPVRAACLADVMAWEQPSRRHGVAGGLSASERQQLHLNLQAPGGAR
jgi:hypothetical protein